MTSSRRFPQFKDARGQHKEYSSTVRGVGAVRSSYPSGCHIVAVARGENQNLWITRLKTKKVAHPQEGFVRRVDSG